jgi:superfamily II DNA or RNA helicase
MNSFKGLFDYQIKGKNEIYNAFKRGIDKVCFVLCMGLGKTTVVCDIIKDGNNYNRKTLVLVHRDNLVRQFAKRLLDQFNIASGIILGKHKRELYLPIQISSRQSMIKIYKKFNREYFNLIIVDEAHYILGDSYLEILNYFTNYKLI